VISKFIKIITVLVVLPYTAIAGTAEKKFQNQLKAMGYDVGVIDGIIGSKSIAAYRKALTANSLSFDGKIDENDYAILEKIYSEQTKSSVTKIENCKYLTKSGISRSKLVVPHRGEMLNVPSAIVQTTFGKDLLYTLVFPHKVRSKPEYTEGFGLTSCGNKMNYLGTLGVDLNMVRDSVEIKLSNGKTGVVIAETGGEYPHANPKIWEHGKVWLAQLENNKISIKVLENRLAFFHSVTTGDINGDGFDDVIVQYFTSRDNLLKNNGFLLFLQQDNEGNFKRVKPPMKNSTFGSAVLLTNLDDDVELEIVQAGYKKPVPRFKGGFKIYDKTNNRFKKKIEIKRENLLAKGSGVSKISSMDFDNDGDNDLLLQAEAKGKGLLLYENLGDFSFSLREDLFEDLSSDTSIFQWREAVVTDVNNDGFQDIVLNGWGGKEWFENNIGAAVFINRQGKTFERQIKKRKLHQQEQHSYPAYFKYYKYEDMNSFMFFGLNGMIKQIFIPESIFSDE